MAKLLDTYKSDFILLCEAGFIAVNQMDEQAATNLFKASSLLKPENSLPKVGMGYMYLLQLRLKEACDTFNNVLETDPENEMAKTFLGISLSFSPNQVAKGEKILTESAKHSKDPSVKLVADSALEFVDKFVKKPINLMDAPLPKVPKNEHKKAK